MNDDDVKNLVQWCFNSSSRPTCQEFRDGALYALQKLVSHQEVDEAEYSKNTANDFAFREGIKEAYRLFDRHVAG